MEITQIRHDWPEKTGFMISRPNGHKQYTFLHFTTPVNILVDGQIVTAQSGACIFYSPGTPQFCASESEVIHNWMHASLSLKPLLAQYGIAENQILYPAGDGFISELFQKMETEYFLGEPFGEELIDGYLKEFLIQFSRAISGAHPRERISRNDAEKLKLLRQEFLSRPEENWSVGKMAERLSLSTSRFHTVYKIVFGTSPINDVMQNYINNTAVIFSLVFFCNTRANKYGLCIRHSFFDICTVSLHWRHHVCKILKC